MSEKGTASGASDPAGRGALNHVQTVKGFPTSGGRSYTLGDLLRTYGDHIEPNTGCQTARAAPLPNTQEPFLLVGDRLSRTGACRTA